MAGEVIVESSDTKQDRSKFIDVLGQMLSKIAEGYVKDYQDSPEDAKGRAALAMSIIQKMAQGTTVYIGKGHLWQVDQKHYKIYERFNGFNHKELALEYGISTRMIYKIVRRVGKAVDKKRQPEFEF
jgi:Mor family transcriptional regulator